MRKPVPAGRKSKPPKGRGLLGTARKKGRKKLTPLPKLDAKLWKLFSLWIRQKYAKDGYVECITCPAKKHWREMQAGHFVPRGSKKVKFDEKNVHPQCGACNGFRMKHGTAVYEYGIRIDEMYGSGTAEGLRKAEGVTHKITRAKYEELIKHYTKLLKENNFETK